MSNFEERFPVLELIVKVRTDINYSLMPNTNRKKVGSLRRTDFCKVTNDYIVSPF